MKLAIRIFAPPCLALAILASLPIEPGSTGSLESIENGDADGSGTQNLADVIYLLNFLYLEGPSPVVIPQDPEFPPVGSVIDWWRPEPTTPLPDGYVLCDGASIDDPLSPLFGQLSPNLSGRLIRGASNLDGVGASGGHSSHAHPSLHEHGTTSATLLSAAHLHTWARFVAGGNGGTWLDGFDTVINSLADGIDGDGAGIYPLAISGANTNTYRTSAGGSHVHSCAEVQSFAEMADSSLEENLPESVQLIKLLRIR